MIPVTPAPEPPDFCAKVRVPGWRSLYEKCGKTAPPPFTRPRGHGKPFAQVEVETRDAAGRRSKDPVQHPESLPGNAFEPYWTEALQDLLVAYDRVCAYCCFRIHASATPSVDHMAPKSRAWDRVYEWENYRLAALAMNAAQREYTDVIDPFEVQPGWFALELTYGQVQPGPATTNDPALRARVVDTIDRLGLNNSGLLTDRLRDIEDYERGEVGWDRLREESPFVAHEIERQGKR